jgi:ABC-2 type transport system ATP-binding protein
MLIEIVDLTVNGKLGLPYLPILHRKRSGLNERSTGWLKRQLSAGMEAKPVLKSIACHFSYGINMILGPNGSGKSTLLKILDGIILPDAGRVLIDGQTAAPAFLRQNIGYLPQNFGFYPQLTAWEMLDYIALLKGIGDRETRKYNVKKVVDHMGLLTVADRKVGTYSRGMRQKVGIAQALLGNPPVLILDEPTAGLDPEARNNLRGMLAEIGQEKVIIWASSLIADTYCADRVLILDGGERRFWGTPTELADCGRSPNEVPLITQEGMDERHWSSMVEQGYRTILSLRDN